MSKMKDKAIQQANDSFPERLEKFMEEIEVELGPYYDLNRIRKELLEEFRSRTGK